MADDVVSLPVDKHTDTEDYDTYVDKWLAKPIGIIVFRCKEENPATLHQGVECIECHTHQHNTKRHLRIATHQKREDKRTLEIMQLKQSKEHQRNNIPPFIFENYFQNYALRLVFCLLFLKVFFQNEYAN